MFHFLGQVVVRRWFIILLVWLIVLAATRLTAPRWEEIVQDQEFGFLPVDSPSRRSEEVFKRAFADDHLGSNLILLVRRQASGSGNPEATKKWIEDVLEPKLRQIAEEEGGLSGETVSSDDPFSLGETGERSADQARSIIARIRTPNAPARGALLVSEDSNAFLVIAELTTEFRSYRNWPLITKVEEMVRKLHDEGQVPAGFDIFVTGSAVLGRDHSQAQVHSAKSTELLTVVLVVILLILIYRAPLLAMIPLVTVYLSIQISLTILAHLAQLSVITLFEGVQIYITVLSYGAGVDYCLFLTARYKEELDSGASLPVAVSGAIEKVGGALTASAATVICGIGMMMFAQFGKFRQAGFAIPLSLGIVLIATLTLTPALLLLARRWAFWPQSNVTTALGLGWDKLGNVLLRRPGTIWLTCIAAMAPFALAAVLLYNHLSFDLIGNLPKESPSMTGIRAMQEHFPAGLTGPLSVLLVNPHMDFSTPEGRTYINQMTDRLQEQKEELSLADLRSLAVPLGITQAAERAFSQTDLPKETLREAIEREAKERYLTDLGERTKTGTRFDLILNQSPFARQSIENLNRIEQAFVQALPSALVQGSDFYFLGATVSVRDLQTVEEQDRVRIEILVMLSVFLVLLLLLRNIVVSLYLILSVLLSYYTTLGVTFAIFWLLDPGFMGIDWKVAIFLFTILIAVGEDYNIFLIARITEEQKIHGPLQGITAALARTGPIISSCGLIMAGTFASLLSGSLTEMKQLGFGLAFGVLLDTFVVRPILVPTFLILWHDGRLVPRNWLGRRSL